MLRESWYHIAFVVLHILAVVVGFGTVLLNGVYAAQARQRKGPGGLAIVEANVFVTTRIAEPAIYSVPVFGVLAVVTSGNTFRFGQTWVWLSLVLFAIAIAISLALLQPRVRQMLALQREMAAAGPPPADGPPGPPPQAAQVEALGKQLGGISGVLHLLFVVILVLMIWKPGLV